MTQPKIIRILAPGLRADQYDLVKVNEAMDAVVAHGGDPAAGRYALVHTHNWPASEAVQYIGAADFFLSNGIDPNEPHEIITEVEPTP